MLDDRPWAARRRAPGWAGSRALPWRAEPTRKPAELGRALLGEHLLAFEAASLLLLAAIIGAVVIARRRDPEPSTGREPSSLPLIQTREEAP